MREQRSLVLIERGHLLRCGMHGDPVCVCAQTRLRSSLVLLHSETASGSSCLALRSVGPFVSTKARLGVSGQGPPKPRSCSRGQASSCAPGAAFLFLHEDKCSHLGLLRRVVWFSQLSRVIAHLLWLPWPFCALDMPSSFNYYLPIFRNSSVPPQRPQHKMF